MLQRVSMARSFDLPYGFKLADNGVCGDIRAIEIRNADKVRVHALRRALADLRAFDGFRVEGVNFSEAKGYWIVIRGDMGPRRHEFLMKILQTFDTDWMPIYRLSR